MNVGQIIKKLEKCNEEATVSCIVPSQKDDKFHSTEVIRTHLDNDLVEIIVMEINGKNISKSK
ncbi:MAG: hypothetical protein ACFFA7_17350 [Promethearchaeota archaeon]